MSSGIVEYDGREVDPASSFALLRIQQRQAGSFPKSLRVIMWNCRGLKLKNHQVWDLFDETGADVLVLNETFRSPGTVWPRNLPPCVGEGTSSQGLQYGQRRIANGVAILVNPKSITSKGKIRRVELLEVDNTLGTKVVMKINICCLCTNLRRARTTQQVCGGGEGLSGD